MDVLFHRSENPARQRKVWRAAHRLGSQFRETVFGWTRTTFPFTTVRGRKLRMKKHPTIRVVGKAFYDAKHAGATPNRRSNDPKLTVWEIHPVMKLEILKEDDD